MITYGVDINLLNKKIESLTSLSDTSSSEINKLIQSVNIVFDKFFSELSNPVFVPKFIFKGDIVSPDDYNYNLKSIYNDITAFYAELSNLIDSQLKAYNYAAIVADEILNKADSLSSIVLDLNILNNFNKQDIIVAGDDFKNLDYVDLSAGTTSDLAELLLDGGGIGLSKQGTEDVSLSEATISVSPLSPLGATSDGVNIKPTPGNFERFYEGNYYNFLGLSRPEGGSYNIRYIKNPVERGDVPDGDVHISSETSPPQKRIIGADVTDGYFLDFGATEEDKKKARLKMLDKDPNTFWECEYLYKLSSSLVDNISTGNVEEVDPAAPDTGFINIDLEKANELAKNYDFSGRDLLIEIVIELAEPKSINFVAINPILFGSSVFPKIQDISTAEPNSDQFITVDGWNSSEFSKTLTPEANEFLTDTQLRVTLAPNRYSYKGQGIFPFPVRYAKKVRLLILVTDPIAQPYDKTIVLLKKTINVQGEITTVTKKGLFA